MDDEPARWLELREQSAWRAFLDMHAQVMVRLNRELQDDCGVSVADFSVLMQLSEHVEGRLRMLELARGLGWEKSRLSHQLSRMQQRGLISRFHCAEDRRGAYVALTETGRDAVHRAAQSHVASVRRYVFDQLSAEQVDGLADAAGTVVTRLQAECTERGFADDADPGGDCPRSAGP